MLLVACTHPCSLRVYSLISAEIQHTCSLLYGSCYPFVNNNNSNNNNNNNNFIIIITIIIMSELQVNCRNS